MGAFFLLPFLIDACVMLAYVCLQPELEEALQIFQKSFDECSKAFNKFSKEINKALKSSLV